MVCPLLFWASTSMSIVPKIPGRANDIISLTHLRLYNKDTWLLTTDSVFDNCAI